MIRYRLIVVSALSFGLTLVSPAQEPTPAAKASKGAKTPKAEPAEKAEEKPKILTFQPDASVPAPARRAANGGNPETTPAQIAEGPSKIVAAFFTSLREGKVDEGYAALTKGSNIAEKPEELRQLKAKTKEAIEMFGSILGYDFVESRAVGQRLVRATFLSQGKVFPLRWRFYFYKPEETWRLIDLRVDDKLTGIFDEAEERPADAKSSGLQ